MKKFITKVTTAILVGTLCLSITGCGKSSTTASSNDAEQTESDASQTENDAKQTENEATQTEAEQSGKELEIPVVYKVTGIPFATALENGVKKAGEELGVNTYMVGPTDGDAAQQVKIVEDLVNKGVDGLVVVPIDAAALEPVLQKAKDKGIKVVTTESPDLESKDWDIEMIDDKSFATTAAESLAQATGGEGEYVFFVGGLSVVSHNAWADYARDYLKEKYPKLVEVTDRIPCGEDAELSHTKTLELLKTYPDLKGIISWGSQGPIGAAQALREKGLSDKVYVTGNLMPTQGAEYLADGSVDLGLLWNPADQGYATVYAAKTLIEGGDLADPNFEIPVIGKGTANNNVLTLNAVLEITKDNASTLGF